MASPITFRNVGNVNFSDSNKLALESTEALERNLNSGVNRIEGLNQKEISDDDKAADSQIAGLDLAGLANFNVASAAANSRLTAGEYQGKLDAAITGQRTKLKGEQEFKDYQTGQHDNPILAQFNQGLNTHKKRVDSEKYTTDFLASEEGQSLSATNRAKIQSQGNTFGDSRFLQNDSERVVLNRQEDERQQIAVDALVNTSTSQGNRDLVNASNKQGIAQYAEENNLPLTSAGRIDYSAIGPEERIQHENNLRNGIVKQTNSLSAQMQALEQAPLFGELSNDERTAARDNLTKAFAATNTLKGDKLDAYNDDIASGTAQLTRNVERSAALLQSSILNNPYDTARSPASEAQGYTEAFSEAKQLAPDSSGFGGYGGQGLRDVIAEHRLAGTPSYMVKLAMLAASENEEETVIGDRTIDKEVFDSTLEALLADPSNAAAATIVAKARERHENIVDNQDQNLSNLKYQTNLKYRENVSAGDDLFNRKRRKQQDGQIGTLGQFEDTNEPVGGDAAKNLLGIPLDTTPADVVPQATQAGVSAINKLTGSDSTIALAKNAKDAAFYDKYQAMSGAEKAIVFADKNNRAIIKSQNKIQSAANRTKIRKDSLAGKDLSAIQLSILQKDSPRLFQEYIDKKKK